MYVGGVKSGVCIQSNVTNVRAFHLGGLVVHQQSV